MAVSLSDQQFTTLMGVVRTAVEASAEAQEEAAEARDRVEDLEEQVADQEARIADLEARGKAAARKCHHLEEEIERVEEAQSAPESDAVEEEAPDASGGEQAPQTPLEQVVGLPEHLAEEELTANQERARFIAQDVRDYAERVPAGYAIPSTDLRKVLKAKDGATPHTQTVARVMDFLDDLGGEEVTLVKRRGTKRIAFSEDAVERLDEHAARAREAVDADPGDAITGVVMGGR
jgi:chemotaxis regulatin CheY-phosphate phosphatase CheZ